MLFPFGHGLSYTTFEYSDLKLSQDTISDQDTLTVHLKVKNSGQVEGKEIVQLYVGMENSAVFRARAELKGFEKISLKPGKNKQSPSNLTTGLLLTTTPQLMTGTWKTGPTKFQWGHPPLIFA